MNPTLNRIQKTINRREFLERRLNGLTDKLNRSVERRDRLRRDIYLDSGALEAVALIVEKISETSLKRLDGLVNEALEFIFFDKKIKMFHKIYEKRNNRHLDFYTEEIVGDRKVLSNVRKGQGEGVRTIRS